MRRSLPLQTPPSFQRYDCTMCGACCRAGFAVVATEEERARIQSQGWDKDPDFPHRGEKLFIKQIGGEWVLAQDTDGACIFLDERNRCRIHAKFGLEGKPFACRPYPFMFLATGNQVRVNLRFDCPSVAANAGRPLPEHRSDLAATAALSVPAAAAALDPPPFRPGVKLGWKDILAAADAFDTIVAAEHLDITRRMLACTDLLGLLRGARIEDLQGKSWGEFLKLLTTSLIRGVEENPLERRRPIGLLPGLFRQAAGLYGRLDRMSDTRIPMGAKVMRLGQRLSYSLQLLSRWGSMPPVRPGLPRVRFRALEPAFGIPSADASEVLTRYYRVKFGSLGFCGRAYYGWPFLEGAGSLLLTYPFILWYARLFAVGDGRDHVDARDMEQAVRVVDRPRGISVPLSLRPERFRVSFLSEHENLSTLVVWYGT